MPQFMLVLYDDPKQFARYTPEEVQKVIEEYGAWAKRLSEDGRLAGGHKLAEDGGRLLRIKGSQISVVDGPYAESKEVLAGYFLVNAKDYGQAVEISQSCPHARYGVRIDIRQLDSRCDQEGS